MAAADATIVASFLPWPQHFQTCTAISNDSDATANILGGSRPRMPMQRPKRSRNSTRDREKAETIALRRLVNELEGHLAVLKSPQQVSWRPLCSMTSAWKRVAERQKLAKIATQHQNSALVTEAQRNADWIQRLWELLRETRSIKQSKADLQHCRWTDSLVIDRLKTEVRVASLNTVGEFAANGIRVGGFVSSPCEVEDPEEDRWSDTVDPKNRTSRIVCVRHLPFDAHSTSTAVWSALTVAQSAPEASSTAPAPATCVAIERTHDACSLKYSQPLSIRGQTTQLNAHAVAQALAGGEAYGSKLFVWRSRNTVPLCDDNGISTSVFCSDDIWIAVTSTSCQASTIAIIAQSKIESQLDALRVSHSSTGFQQDVLVALGACVHAIAQTAEDLLMDGKIVGHRSSSSSEFDLVSL